jgi:hypothetical protein
MQPMPFKSLSVTHVSISTSNVELLVAEGVGDPAAAFAWLDAAGFSPVKMWSGEEPVFSDRTFRLTAARTV